jgi:hypothetical protein
MAKCLGVGKVRAQLNGPLERRDRRVGVLRFAIDDAEIVKGVGVIWLQRQRPVEGGDRLVSSSKLVEQGAVIVVHLRRRIGSGNRALQQGDPIGGLPLIKADEAQQVIDFGIVRVAGKNAHADFGRFVIAAGPEMLDCLQDGVWRHRFSFWLGPRASAARDFPFGT